MGYIGAIRRAPPYRVEEAVEKKKAGERGERVPEDVAGAEPENIEARG